MDLRVVVADCHFRCRQVTDKDTLHTLNVNPLESTSYWRVDCDTCATCLKILPSREEAVDYAIAHLKERSDQ